MRIIDRTNKAPQKPIVPVVLRNEDRPAGQLGKKQRPLALGYTPKGGVVRGMYFRI